MDIYNNLSIGFYFFTHDIFDIFGESDDNVSYDISVWLDWLLCNDVCNHTSDELLILLDWFPINE